MARLVLLVLLVLLTCVGFLVRAIRLRQLLGEVLGALPEIVLLARQLLEFARQLLRTHFRAGLRQITLALGELVLPRGQVL
mgnify:CR=1 FL=1